MENNKGLCMTCDFDTTCIFNRAFPVIFCEEFSVSKAKKIKILNPVNSICVYDDEVMENCFCGE